MNWQPISKAPKDGTVVDLWCDGWRAPDCRWTNEFAWHVIGKSWRCLVGKEWKALGANPTHWMKVTGPDAIN